MVDYSECIFEDSFFNVIKKDNSIIINLKHDNNLLISSWLNGGTCHNMEHVVNQTVEGSDYDLLLDNDYAGFQKNHFKKLGINPDKSAGLITSACMDNVSISTLRYEQLKVTSIVTAGADKNGIKAGDASSFYEYDNKYLTHFGTINIFILINANLHDGALVNAIITATEAKTSVLQDLKVESQFSTNISTGTGTDGICVVSDSSSQNHIENAGKHSKLGELIARTVQEATRKALYMQTFMSTEFQCTVLSRLSRFNIVLDDFLNETSMDTIVYLSEFYYFNKSGDNVAFVSSIINLIDELQNELLELGHVELIIKKLIEKHLGMDVLNEKIGCINDILSLLIKSINQYILFNKDNR